MVPGDPGLLGGVLIVSTPSEDPEARQREIRSCNQGTEEGKPDMLLTTTTKMSTMTITMKMSDDV